MKMSMVARESELRKVVLLKVRTRSEARWPNSKYVRVQAAPLNKKVMIANATDPRKGVVSDARANCEVDVLNLKCVCIDAVPLHELNSDKMSCVCRQVFVRYWKSS